MPLESGIYVPIINNKYISKIRADLRQRDVNRDWDVFGIENPHINDLLSFYRNIAGQKHQIHAPYTFVVEDTVLGGNKDISSLSLALLIFAHMEITNLELKYDIRREEI